MSQFSETIEEYLETICRLGGGGEPVTLSSLASRLDISPVSVHEMVRKLALQQLVTYQPYRGVMLTPAGKQAASRIVRRHRLWERFLHDVLGLPWDQVHVEANRLEHATSPIVAEKLAEFLDNPEFCPHGHPIEPTDCECDPYPYLGERLSELGIGEESFIASVPEDDPTLLGYVDRLGMRPGTRVRVLEIAPLDGTITLEVAGQKVAVGRQLASLITISDARYGDKTSGQSAAA